MSFEAVDVYVLDSTPQQSPLAGVTVKVLSQDGTQAFTQGATDSSGHVGFLLPSASPGGTVYQLRMYQFGTSFTQPQYVTIDELQAQGRGVAGTPGRVRDFVRQGIDEGGANYLLCRFAFGDLLAEEARQSVDLFASEVMPEFGAAMELPAR